MLDKVEDKSCHHIGNKDNQTPLEHDIPTLVYIQKEVREGTDLRIRNIKFQYQAIKKSKNHIQQG